MNDCLQKMIEAAQAGGQIIRRYFGEVLQAEEKTNAGDLKTKADVESEERIVTILQQAFPAYNVYAEESGRVDKKSEYTFVIDPLDGTNNFVLGIPEFTISIGLLKGKDSVLGVIYNPILDQTYHAEKGKGAFLNSKRIHVNREHDITHATVSYVAGYNTPREYSEELAHKLRDLHIKRQIDHWAPAYDYCLLASGRIEAVMSKDGDLEDYAAAKVIVAEAGGKVTSFNNGLVSGSDPDFLATNDTSIHEELIAILN